MSQHSIHVGQATFYQGERRTIQDWQKAVKQLLDEGHPLMAFDLATQGLRIFPDDLHLKQLVARAHINAGALAEARAILEPLCHPLRPDDETLERLHRRFRDTVLTLARGPLDEPRDTREIVSSLFEEIARGVQRVRTDARSDAESMGLLGRVYKDLWRRGHVERDRDDQVIDFARLSRDTYLRGFEATRDYYPGINAATMSLAIGETETAQRLAGEARSIVEERLARADKPDYWLLATLGEARLLQGDQQGALTAYKEAAELAGSRHQFLKSSIEQLELLAQLGLDIPKGLFRPPKSNESVVLTPPTVVLFAGHMIDHKDQASPRFPAGADAEAAVTKALEEQLEALDARIGYSSAACGADILFIEAMLGRGGEVHILLPFQREDFVAKSVEYAGSRWVQRFDRALRLATSVKYATQEQFLNDEELFDHGARVARGLAELHAERLRTCAHLVAVYDGGSVGGIGGTGAQVRSWSDTARRHIIDLGQLLGTAKLTESDSQARARIGSAVRSEPEHPWNREIRAMLFADVVGYSKLPEQDTPGYYKFLERVAGEVAPHAEAGAVVNTWGDAIFVAMQDAKKVADYAFALQHIIRDTDWTTQDITANLDVRIGLHAGPVYFADRDPVTGNTNLYGAHVNRAARIEPITLPGHIFASEQFISLLAAEAAEQPELRERYAFEYVGTKPLAKRFGSQPLYHLRRAKPR